MELEVSQLQILITTPDTTDAEEDGADGGQGEDHGAEGVVEAPPPRAPLVAVGDHLKGEREA